MAFDPIPFNDAMVTPGQRPAISWLMWFRAVRDMLSRINVGNGDPSGVIVADAGALYLRLDGAGPNLYVKEGAANNGTSAGWAAK